MTIPLSPRLDAHLVKHGLARSRGHAASLVADGRVTVAGVPVLRAAAPVHHPAQVAVLGDPAADFASRAGAKLEAALGIFALDGLRVAGRDCLDAGASTGGFTDVLLRRGARTVISVDVGHDQLRAHLRTDRRVTARDGLDVRELARRLLPTTATTTAPTAPMTTAPTAPMTTAPTAPMTTAPTAPGTGTNSATRAARTTRTERVAADPSGDDLVARLPAAVVVADLSFISLRAVLPALSVLTAPAGDLLTLVKPQFEVGRARLPRTGVVLDPADRTAALLAVAEAAAGLGWGPAGAVASSVAGRSGNVEFVVWWRRERAPAAPGRWAALAATDSPATGTAATDTAASGTAASGSAKVPGPATSGPAPDPGTAPADLGGAR